MITGTIEALAFGGSGILRDDRHVIFVPFTAPGDKITARILKQKKRHAEGKLVTLLEASQERVTPQCPHFGICGGCQLQHLNTTAQLAAKRQFIQDSLRHLQAISVPPITPPSHSFAYRQHIRLHLHRTEPNAPLQLGYMNLAEHVPISHCPIFTANDDPLFQHLSAFLQTPAWNSISTGHLRILKQQKGYLIVIQLEHFPADLIAACPKALSPTIAGIILASPTPIHFGHTECHWNQIQFSPFGFIQNHPEESLHLYQFILDQIPSNTRSALDLYCGVGITTLMLGKRGIQTVGVESHAETIQWAKKNAATHQVDSVSFHVGTAEKLGKKLLESNSCDWVLVNPPRIGLAPSVVSALIQSAPEGIVYVSCMPPTLARDLKTLLEGGYRIQKIQGFDLFPQTTHVETVVVLTKTAHQSCKSSD